MKRIFFSIKVICAAAVCLFAPAHYAYPVVVDKIVCVVNGEAITQREVAQYLYPIYAEYQKEYTGKNLEEKMIEAEDIVINQLIEDKLILSEAKKEGVQAGNDEVDARIREIIKQRFGSEEKFREVLAIQNISLSEMKEALMNDIIKAKIIRMKAGGKVIITPSEVRRYYDEHINEFVEHETTEALNILVRKKDTQDDNARESIKKIKALLDAGEDFEAIAKKYSEGPNAKGGGRLGLIAKGEMIKEIDEAIFALEPGQVSEIVETPIGYHIFKVTKKLPAMSKSFDSAKDEITETIYKKKIQRNLAKWIKELKENAYISIK